MLEKLILENENKIEKFDIAYYKRTKNYPVVASLSALETTNEIQKCYFEQVDRSVSFNVMKLYALLQSLFVSIDSLYALSYSLTKSKSFININKNQVLRELKYIRNDVVGHPANRMYNSSTLAYCILENDSVSKEEFSYNIYTGQGVEKKKVDIIELIHTYYMECNTLLKELYSVATAEQKNSMLTNLSIEALNLFDMEGDYIEALLKLKRLYLNIYPNAQSSQHRFLWRMELIEDLINYKNSDEEIQELMEYAIGLEIIKIYQILSGKLYTMSLGKRKPFLVSSFYRFIKKNKTAIQHIDKINDIKNPLIKNSLAELLKLAISKNAIGPIKYINLLQDLYEKQNDSLLYSLSLPLKEYKKGK